MTQLSGVVGDRSEQGRAQAALAVHRDDSDVGLQARVGLAARPGSGEAERDGLLVDPGDHVEDLSHRASKRPEVVDRFCASVQLHHDVDEDA
ncbi:MAG TPA: hypothetical protein VFM40_09280 [Actinomycetota bacterium]|nr:hypothetical protein [Actinomycetota bacterium]